jgi:hypothetical protein
MNSTVLALKRVSDLRYALTLAAAALAFCGSASATLLDRGPDMVYDNVLNITWVRDASLCATLNNCVNRNDTFVTGGMTWSDANTWAANLVFGGFDDWRLPYASVIAGTGPTQVDYTCTGAGDELACRDNEMGYMYYYNLDGNLGDDKTGNQNAVGGQMLTDIQPVYWSGTEFSSGVAWDFGFVDGLQGSGDELMPLAAWAVRPGDVAAVPEPASLLLIGIGLAGLGFSRRKRSPIGLRRGGIAASPAVVEGKRSIV